MDRPELLIIDDNVVMLRLLKNVLSQEYRVITKRNSLDAFRWLEEGHYPSLVLMDLHHRDHDRFQIIRNLKISGLYRDIPVVLLLSERMENEDLAAQLTKADACFSKPFNPAILQAEIASLINAHTSHAYSSA